MGTLSYVASIIASVVTVTVALIQFRRTKSVDKPSETFGQPSVDKPSETFGQPSEIVNKDQIKANAKTEQPD